MARGRAVRNEPRIVVGILLLAVVVAVVVDNRHDVRVGYVVGDVDAPLISVLLVTAVLGAAIGWLLLHRPGHRN